MGDLDHQSTTSSNWTGRAQGTRPLQYKEFTLPRRKKTFRETHEGMVYLMRIFLLIGGDGIR